MAAQHEIFVKDFSQRLPTYVVVLGESTDVGILDRCKNEPVLSQLAEKGDLVYFTVTEINSPTGDHAKRVERVDGTFERSGVYKWCEAQVAQRICPLSRRLGNERGEYRASANWYDDTVKAEVEHVMRLFGSFGVAQIQRFEMSFSLRDSDNGDAGPFHGENQGYIQVVSNLFSQNRGRPRKVNSSFKYDYKSYHAWYYFQTDVTAKDFIENRFAEHWRERKGLVTLKYTVTNRERLAGRRIEERVDAVLGNFDPARLNHRRVTEYELETVTKTFTVKLAKINNRGKIPKSWTTLSEQWKRDHSQMLYTLEQRCSAVLEVKRADEYTFNGVRLFMLGVVNSGKSCLIYNWIRAVNGEVNFALKGVRCAPFGMQVRGDARNNFKTDGTVLKGHAVPVNFYQLMRVIYETGANRAFEGFLSTFDTQGLPNPLIDDENEEILAGEGAEMHKAAMAKKNLTIRHQKEEALDARYLSKRALFSYFHRIVPDVLVFVVDAVDYMIDQQRYVRCIASIQNAHTSWVETEVRALANWFVVVLTKMDLFELEVEKKGFQLNDKTEELKMFTAEQFGIEMNDINSRIFCMTNIPVPTEADISEAFAAPEEYCLRAQGIYRSHLEMLSQIVHQAQQFRNAAQEEELETGEPNTAYRVLRYVVKETGVLDTVLADTLTYHAFLSYRQEDARKAFGRSGIEAIRGAIAGCYPSLQVYCDMTHRDDASRIRDILDNVAKSAVFIAVLSESYLQSKYCLAELLTAFEAKKPIVAITWTKRGSRSVSYVDYDTRKYFAAVGSSLKNDEWRSLADFLSFDGETVKAIKTELKPRLLEAVDSLKLELSVKYLRSKKGTELETNRETFERDFRAKFRLARTGGIQA